MGDKSLLSDAIRLLVDRFPSLPHSDAWKHIDPELAATIHLRYLDAYIQNQQLLLHLCDKERTKAETIMNSAVSQMNDALGLLNPNNLIPCKNYNSSSAGGIVPYNNNHQEIVPYEPINKQNPSIIKNDNKPSTFLPFIQKNFNQPTLPRLRNDDFVNIEQPITVDSGDKFPKSGMQGVTFNKYKNSWCASLVDADGLRRRKFFNIRKYGFDGAKVLALDYLSEYHRNNSSVQPSLPADVAFDRKERNLIQDILSKADCDSDSSEGPLVTFADSYNYSRRFKEKFSDICGLVFIPGVLMFATITYDNADKRVIKVFSIQSSTFEEASQNAIASLQGVYKRSKISGILPFHTDKSHLHATCYDLNMDVSKSFSLDKGFVTTHKEAIAFRRDILKSLKKNSDDSKTSGVLKFPGVYYDSYSKCWVSSCNHSGIRKEAKFYIKKHGAICARELAIRHRVKWIKNRQL